MKNRKPVIYTTAFLLLTALLYLLLVSAAAIPNEAIQANLEKSALSYKEKDAFSFENGSKFNSVADNYADVILLGVSWNMGIGNPFVSALDTKYNDGGDYGESAGLYLSVAADAEPNTDYTRYWHGSAMLIRPLLIFTDADGIKSIGFTVVLILALITALVLIKRRHLDFALCTILALAAVQIWNIRLSMEYQPAIMICFILCPLFLWLEKKDDTYLTVLSVVSGTLVAFFDFLTTEIITLLLPLILVVAVRAKEDRLGSFKDMVWLILKCALCWGIAYAFTFLIKWTAASLVTGDNKFITAFSSAGERFGGSIASEGADNPLLTIFLAPLANLSTLFGGETRVDYTKVLIGISASFMIIVSILYLFKKKDINKTALKLLSLLGAVVFARYMILGNHSYLHEFFTYRSLIAPITAVLCGIAICSELHSKKGAKKK